MEGNFVKVIIKNSINIYYLFWFNLDLNSLKKTKKNVYLKPFHLPREQEVYQFGTSKIA